MTSLSTHVLDLTHGRPAAAVAVRLLSKERRGALTTLADVRTDEDGRAKLLDVGDLIAGRLRLEFEIGAYFDAVGPAPSPPRFLETVVIDFTVTDRTVHYHVPLLVSPFGYSTYRGS
jgi:5-hydroxyisourate hydrolase